MKLLLIGREQRLCEAWAQAFSDADEVEIYYGRFEDVMGSFDCLVSPANSFGLMDGGIDAAITAYFGDELQRNVQTRIWDEYSGEQPVGTCLMVPTGNELCPWLAHCPTMTIPMEISQTRNAYAAMLAALTCASRANVSTLACPGLGTGTGRVTPEDAAKQMRFAFECWQNPRQRMTWQYAQDRFWLGK